MIFLCMRFGSRSALLPFSPHVAFPCALGVRFPVETLLPRQSRAARIRDGRYVRKLERGEGRKQRIRREMRCGVEKGGQEGGRKMKGRVGTRK